MLPARILRTLLTLFAATAALYANGAQQRLEGLLQIELDPTQCYRVRDLFLEREDVKFYFTDGTLILGKPFRGREIVALFLADRPMDTGELLVIPPLARERQSVARFTGETVLNEKFRNALMFFTDDTAEALRQGLAQTPFPQPDPEEGALVAKRWSPIVRNILEGLSLRILADTLSGVDAEQGFFAAAVGGVRFGRFDIVVDPLLDGLVSIGQSVWRSGRQYYEVWCQFEARTFRTTDREPPGYRARLDNYRIDAKLGLDLRLDVSAKARLRPGHPRRRAFSFEVSRQLTVSELLVNGEPGDFVQLNQAIAGSVRRERNNVILLYLPEPLQADDSIELEFRYAGQVVRRAGEGVYFVDSRANWYPRAAVTFSHYEMRFRYPAELDLVATGEPIESSETAGFRTALFRTAEPIRLAGFNLGVYRAASREVERFTLEVRANEIAEDSLQQLSPTPLILPRSLGRYRRGGSSPTVVLPQAPELRPAERLEIVADESARTFEFFIDRFGPPATPRVVISPIPGNFGQGFSGLVYAATRSYFAPSDPPLAELPVIDQIFYAKLLRPHELAHQWWGNLVTVDASADLWIMEALANYSALLYLESAEGPTLVRRLLNDFRDALLKTNEDGETIESAGAITLGERLRLASFPSAYRAILYGKGAWIFHMLRGRLGDDAFFRFLRSLTSDYERRPLTTELLREQAARFMPPEARDRDLRIFFDQWVYDTGVPRLRLDYGQKRNGETVRVTGMLIQQETPAHFTVPVRLRLQAASGKTWDLTVLTDGSKTPFSWEGPERITRISISPKGYLLRFPD